MCDLDYKATPLCDTDNNPVKSKLHKIKIKSESLTVTQ